VHPRRLRLDAMLKTLTVAPSDADAAAAYGRIVASCGCSGPRVLDRMIAATALGAAGRRGDGQPRRLRRRTGLRPMRW